MSTAVLKRILVLLTCLGCAAPDLFARIEQRRVLDQAVEFGSVLLLGPPGTNGLNSNFVMQSMPLGASVSATIHAVDQCGKIRGTIKLSADGTADGTYAVCAVSGSSSIVLGSVTVTSGTVPVVTGITFHMPDGTVVIPPNYYDSGSVEFGENGIPFPKGFDLFNIAGLSLVSSDSNAYAVATVTPVANGVYSAYAGLEPGRGNRRAAGTVHIWTQRSSAPNPDTGQQPIVNSSGQLVITVRNLPPRIKVAYGVDGMNLGTALTNAAGELKVVAAQAASGTLPMSLDLFSVKTVTLEDRLGKVLASASFQ